MMNSAENRETFCQTNCRCLPYPTRVNGIPHPLLTSGECVLPREDKPFHLLREVEYNIVNVLC